MTAGCSECGAPISAPPFARHGEAYSCERCYLASRHPAPPDELLEGFAEALAAALDAREHETGLHSKRVACHTLVLARRFTRDAHALRQVYWGALLHDIGKIGIPDALLPKRRRSRSPTRSASTAAAIRALAGEAIPLWSRLFAVIDTLDALTSDRPYRNATSFDAAKSEIVSCSGRQFDPRAVDAFLEEETVLRDMVAVKCGDAPAFSH